MSGTITQFQRDRGGVGTLLGEDRKSYTFRRTDVRAVWFHDLTEGATVALESPKNPFGDPGSPSERFRLIPSLAPCGALFVRCICFRHRTIFGRRRPRQLAEFSHEHLDDLRVISDRKLP